MAKPTSFTVPTDIEHPLGTPTGMNAPASGFMINLRALVALTLVVTGILTIGVVAFIADLRLGLAFVGVIMIALGFFLASEEA